MNHLQARASLKSYISNIYRYKTLNNIRIFAKHYVRNQTDNKVDVLENRNVQIEKIKLLTTLLISKSLAHKCFLVPQINDPAPYTHRPPSIPCNLHPPPYNLHSAYRTITYSLHPNNLHSTPTTRPPLYPTASTPSAFSLHLTINVLHPQNCTYLHLTPYILHPI